MISGLVMCFNGMRKDRNPLVDGGEIGSFWPRMCMMSFRKELEDMHERRELRPEDSSPELESESFSDARGEEMRLSQSARAE